jgi:Protein of unknown function (DUF1566)
MHTMTRSLRCLAAATLAAAAVHAEAALLERPGGMVYDTQTDLTWLVDWNAGAGSAFDDGSFANDGRMSWAAANAWAAALVWGGHDDWRLPTASNCLGFNCRTSEMGRLWYVSLGNAAGLPPTQLASFVNVRAAPYWTGTPLAGSPGMAWYFNAQGGSQNVLSIGAQAHAVAVRVGDVSPVPEPSPAWLMLGGLAVLGRLLRRRAGGAA